MITEKLKPKKEKIQFFTDDMAKTIFCFQDTYKASKGGKPYQKTVSIKPIKRK